MTISELGTNFEWPNIFRTIVPKKEQKEGYKKEKKNMFKEIMAETYE